MASKINRSWEKTRTEVHSPQGVEQLRKAVRWGLTRKYLGIAESMFRWEGFDAPVFEDMQLMSQDTVPEVLLMRNGECCFFRDPSTDQVHCLPFVMDNTINIYGKPSGWKVVPVGWTDRPDRQDDAAVQRLRELSLDGSNSVIMRNDLFGESDKDMIEAMVDELVDNVLTMNQLQLLAKSPFIFNVSEDNLLSAKNFFLALSSDRPAIFTNSMGERLVPQVEVLNTRIDPALFEIFDRFECLILEQIGFPCVPITKRAQQTVSEVQSSDERIRMRREEKLLQRMKAAERMNRMWGTSVRCVSVIDEMSGQTESQTEGENGEELS